MLLLYLPFLPLLVLAEMLSAFYPGVTQYTNTEEWSIIEDPETGEIKIIVKRRAVTYPS
jgi:hypothetical protein